MWWERGAEDTNLDKTGMLSWLKKSCPGFGSLLVDFGYFAVVAGVARASFRGSRPKVVAQRTKGTTPWFTEQMAFHESHEKDSRNGRKERKGTRRKARPHVPEPRCPLKRLPPTAPTCPPNLTFNIYENVIYETRTILDQQPQHRPHHQAPVKHPRHTLRALGASKRERTTNH